MVRVHPLECDFELDAPARNRAWYEERGYEPASTALFRTVATDADVVLDIGAHVGYYSLLAKSAAPGATVVAVEASPENAVVLQHNVDTSDHPDVVVVVAAFGAVAGTANIQLTEASDNSGFGGHPNSPTERTVEVPAVTSAELDLPDGHKVVVKLDVEGYELDALTGLEPVLERYADVRMLVEMNPKCLVLAGSSGDDLVERLRGYGFRIFVLEESTYDWRELRPETDWTTLINPASYANLYCVRADRCTTVSAVLHSGGGGGAQRSHTEMVESLVRQGSMVHTAFAEPVGELEVELRSRGGSVTVVPHLAWWTTAPDDEHAHADAWTQRDLVSAELVAAIEQVSPDVVLTQSAVVPHGAVAAAALRLPHVWYLREFIDLDHGLVLPAARAGMATLIDGLSDLVVANSGAVARHLLGSHASRAVVVQPVPRVSLAGGARRAGAPTAAPFRVGVVATLSLGKGQEDAVRALAALRADGVDVELVLVGPDADADRVRVEALAESFGVADRVRILGEVANRDEVYRGLDAVAVTSHAEAFGRVPFEAAAFGVPIVYADTGGPAEYLRDGQTGLAFAPRDADALAAVVRRLVDDPQLARGLADAAAADLLAPARIAAYDAAVHSLVATASRRRGPSPLQDLVGSITRSAVRGLTWRSSADAAQADLHRVVAEHESLVEQFHALRADHHALVTGHLGFVEMHEASVVDVDRVRADLGESRAANATLRRALGDTREALAMAEHTTAAERHVRADIESRLARVEGSRTWQIRTSLKQLFRR